MKLHPITLSVEHETLNLRVAGSSPASGSKYYNLGIFRLEQGIIRVLKVVSKLNDDLKDQLFILCSAASRCLATITAQLMLQQYLEILTEPEYTCGYSAIL